MRQTACLTAASPRASVMAGASRNLVMEIRPTGDCDYRMSIRGLVVERFRGWPVAEGARWRPCFRSSRKYSGQNSGYSGDIEQSGVIYHKEHLTQTDSETQAGHPTT